MKKANLIYRGIFPFSVFVYSCSMIVCMYYLLGIAFVGISGVLNGSLPASLSCCRSVLSSVS